MTRKAASTSLAVLAALALAPLAARAQSAGAGHVAPDAGNVVGGGGASLFGGGDDMVITYSPGGAGGGGGTLAQAGRSARFAGNSDGPQVEYLDTAPEGAGRGREAWLLGGGGDAEVVYASPTRR